jgi:HAD superfamily phosphoserine phosphatase-like hydrolase
VERLLIACDFDGTITERDTLHVIVEEFGTRGLWAAIEPRLRAGEVTLEQAMQEEFATVRATPEQVRDVVRRDAGLRPGFSRRVEWAAAQGHRLFVFSSGFRSVIRDVLAGMGHDDIEVVSPDAVFPADGAEIVGSARGVAWGVGGGRSTRHDLRGRHRGETVILIGDGISDLCVAKTADLVFARAHLARDLTAAGVPFLPFEDFDEVRERLRAGRILAA